MFVFDGHNDVLSKLHRPKPGKDQPFFEENAVGHVDLPRAIKGDLRGGFFAVFVSNPDQGKKEAADLTRTKDGYTLPLAAPVKQKHAYATANEMIDVFDELKRTDDSFHHIVSRGDLEAVSETGSMHALLHLEGAEPIDEELAAIDHFYRRGVRSIGIVWSRPNAFGTGVPFRFPASPDIGPGLTEAGKRLVWTCNERGILVDLAHLNEQGFWDVAKLTDRPLVVSHSNAHAVTPFTRNLTDKQLDAVGRSGGIVGVNFDVCSLRPDGKKRTDTPIADIVRHFTYIVERIGIDHVGFGTDFDGADVPDEVGDATGLPKVTAALRDAGFDDRDLAKLCHDNWLRVLKKTL
jgi:membrane dipeptidase